METLEKLVPRIQKMADNLCRAEGLELVHVECQRESHGRTLRVYIDKSGGVTLDDCAFVSRQLNDLLDVQFDIQEPYNLEVSSPGSKRPLSKLVDFDRFKGKKAKIKTMEAINGQKNFTGVLVGASKEMIALSINNHTVKIPYGIIDRARLA